MKITGKKNWGQNRGIRVHQILNPNESFLFGPQRLCKSSSKSNKNCDRRSADRQTDRQKDASDLICRTLCYCIRHPTFTSKSLMISEATDVSKGSTSVTLVCVNEGSYLLSHYCCCCCCCCCCLLCSSLHPHPHPYHHHDRHHDMPAVITPSQNCSAHS